MHFDQLETRLPTAARCLTPLDTTRSAERWNGGGTGVRDANGHGDPVRDNAARGDTPGWNTARWDTPTGDTTSGTGSKAVATFVVVREEIARRGLSAMLGDLPGVGAVEGCADADAAADVLGRGGYDIVVLGSELANGLSTLARYVTARDVKLLMLLQDLSDQTLAAAARAKVDGFLLASGLTSQRLAMALAGLEMGQMPLPAELALEMMSRFGRFGASGLDGNGLPSSLTPREYQTLQLLAEGLSNKQVATRLRISPHSAKRHVANVLAKLNCPNRTLAVAYAVRAGLLGEGHEATR